MSDIEVMGLDQAKVSGKLNLIKGLVWSGSCHINLLIDEFRLANLTV
jgi:hypothetical protein